MKNIVIVIAVIAALAAVLFALDAKQPAAPAATAEESATESTVENAGAASEDADAAVDTETTETAESPEKAGNATMAEPIIYGNSSAPVMIEEYASFTCPHCAHFYTDVLPELREKYIDTGKAYLKMHSFVRNQPDILATQLVQCQPDNESRQRFAKALFGAQDSWAFSNDPYAALETIAKVGGISPEEFKKCVEDKDRENVILNTRQDATDKRQVDSTPYFFVNGEPIKGAVDAEAFEKPIADALANAGEK